MCIFRFKFGRNDKLHFDYPTYIIYYIIIICIYKIIIIINIILIQSNIAATVPVNDPRVR